MAAGLAVAVKPSHLCSWPPARADAAGSGGRLGRGKRLSVGSPTLSAGLSVGASASAIDFLALRVHVSDRKISHEIAKRGNLKSLRVHIRNCKTRRLNHSAFHI